MAAVSNRDLAQGASMKRTIAVVTTSRADYSHLYWPLKDLQAHPDVDLKLIVLASHLSPEFGSTVREMEADGFPIAARLECLLSSDTDVGMAKSIGVGVLSLADTLGQMRPDLLLLIADRYEMLAPASVALALRIPMAHIEGGEISEGAIDDAVRNALTKMSHIHFTSTELARKRVISMGEEPWRVHRAGAPSLDHLRRSRLLAQAELQQQLALDLDQPTALVAYHPSRYYQRGGCALCGARAAHGADHILLSECGCRQPPPDSTRGVISQKPPPWPSLRQSACSNLLEPAETCSPDDRQLEQRHHGNWLLCTANGECRPAAARKRTARKCARCAADNRLHP
jgi:hypothetical protein